MSRKKRIGLIAICFVMCLIMLGWFAIIANEAAILIQRL